MKLFVIFFVPMYHRWTFDWIGSTAPSQAQAWYVRFTNQSP